MKRVMAVLAVLAMCAGWNVAAQRGGNDAGFAPARVVATTAAVYPINSVAEGTVVLEVSVGAGGEIGDVRVVRDIPSLTVEAVKAVRKWKFAAATLNGRGVRSNVTVAFVFSRPVLF